MQAVTGELGRRDVIAKVTGLLDLDEQASDQVNQLLLCQFDLLAPMQEPPELRAVLLTMVRDEGVRLQHGFEPLASIAGLVPEMGEVFDVVRDVTSVPGDQDRTCATHRRSVWHVP